MPGLPDPGTLVRWGLPVVRAVHDVAAAMTVGLLVLAATIIPETTAHEPPGHRHPLGLGRGRRVGRRPALVGLVLSFADASGTRLDDPAFGPQFQQFVLTIEVLRVAAISMGLALVVAVGASVARRRATMVALAALSVLAVLPLALAGHAAGSASHDTAVNSLAVHLVAAVLWVGGLLGAGRAAPGARPRPGRQRRALQHAGRLVLRPRRPVRGAERLDPAGLLLGPRLAVRRPGPRQGARPRGARPRRAGSSAVAWSTGWPPTRAPVALFARLAVVEVVVMGAAFGLGTALSRSAPPVPDLVPGRVDPAQALTGYPRRRTPAAGSTG